MNAMPNRILCVLLLLVITGFACKSKTKELQPEMKQLTEAVYASGTLVPENEYKVVSSSEGFLKQALVKEGDTVKKGQLLFALSNDNQQTQVAAASELVSKTIPVAAPNAPAIKDLENRIASAKIRLQNDQLQYNRYKNLFDQNAISASSYEKYKVQFETTQHDVQGLEEQLQQQRLSAALQLQQANNQLLIAKTSKANGVLKSYADGVVYDVYKQTGDLISLNQPIALIGSGRMIAKLLIDEDDLGKVKQGQPVLITMDAYPDRIFHAHVEKIYPLLNKVEQSFRVDAIFEDEMPLKLYGLNVEANIVLANKSKAMVIPKNALLAGDSVLVKKGNTAAKVKIKKGISDKDFVQVLGGLPDSSILIIQQ
jgi:HlyD family secretion protein